MNWKKGFSSLLTILFIILFVVSIPIKTDAIDVPVTWGTSQPGTAGFKVYYDGDGSEPLNGTGADQGVSPVDEPDPNSTGITLTGLSYNPAYVAVAAYNDIGQIGEKSSPVRYVTIDSVSNAVPGDYTAGDTIDINLNFATSSYLNNGLLIIELNSGGYLTGDFGGLWKTQVSIPYTIQVGESTYPDPLIVTDIYLDPNDPDVELYDAGGGICTDIFINLNSDPNANVYVYITPGPPSDVQTQCCTN